MFQFNGKYFKDENDLVVYKKSVIVEFELAHMLLKHNISIAFFTYGEGYVLEREGKSIYCKNFSEVEGFVRCVDMGFAVWI